MAFILWWKHWQLVRRHGKAQADILTRVDALYNALQHVNPFDSADGELSMELLRYLRAKTGRVTL